MALGDDIFQNLLARGWLVCSCVSGDGTCGIAGTPGLRRQPMGKVRLSRVWFRVKIKAPENPGHLPLRPHFARFGWHQRTRDSTFSEIPFYFLEGRLPFSQTVRPLRHITFEDNWQELTQSGKVKEHRPTTGQVGAQPNRRQVIGLCSAVSPVYVARWQKHGLPQLFLGCQAQDS